MRRSVLLLALSAMLLGTQQAGSAVDVERVRPGLGYSTGSESCSFGFLLQGSDRKQYASTAGHCGGADEDELLWAPGKGPAVRNDQGRTVGHFVYAVDYDSRGVDFALIRLTSGIRGNPQMCGWGGPTRLLAEERNQPTQLRQHGQGFGLGKAVPNRTAVVKALPREPYTVVQGPFAPGDSGSAMITADGTAMGLVVELTVDQSVPTAGAGIVRLEHAMAAAAKRLRIGLTLRTAPLLPAPLPTAAC